MNEEEKKVDELRASIDEIEEEIGVEVFVNVVEEEGVKEREISEKIRRCEELRKKYVEKTIELERRSPGKSSAFKKVEEDITREVKRMRNLRTKVQNEKIDGEKKVGAKVKAADAKKQVHVKQKAREVTDAAASAKKGVEENDKIMKQKAREVTDAAASAKKGVEENDEIMKQKAREVTDAAASAKKDAEENDKIMKQKAREAKGAAASAQKDNRIAKIVRKIDEGNAEVAKRERDNNIAKIVKNVSEHNTELPSGYVKLDNEVKSEVAAAFPLSQAQRGESVAPSLILPHIPVKNESKKNNDEKIGKNDEDENNNEEVKTKEECEANEKEAWALKRNVRLLGKDLDQEENGGENDDESDEEKVEVNLESDDNDDDEIEKVEKKTATKRKGELEKKESPEKKKVSESEDDEDESETEKEENGEEKLALAEEESKKIKEGNETKNIDCKAKSKTTKSGGEHDVDNKSKEVNVGQIDKEKAKLEKVVQSSTEKETQENAVKIEKLLEDKAKLQEVVIERDAELKSKSLRNAKQAKLPNDRSKKLEIATSQSNDREQTIAVLALLFANRSFQPALFFVMDEIDAALDNTNIGKVAEYINAKTGDKKMNVVVISLKEEFYSQADALVRITTDSHQMIDTGCLISKVLILDLTDYDNTVELHSETKLPRQFDPGINGDWSCSRLNLNLAVGSEGLVSNHMEACTVVESRWRELERLEAGPQCGGHPA